MDNNELSTNLASLGTNCSEFPNNSDAISRQAAIDALKEHRALYCDNTPDAFSKLSHAEKSRVDELDTAIATLVNLPPAEPKKRGMSIDQEKMIVEALSSLYPLKDYEEDAINTVLEALPHWIPVDLENNEPPLEEWVLVSSDGYVMQDCIVERGGKKIWYHGGNIQPDDRYMSLPEPYKGVTE